LPELLHHHTVTEIGHFRVRPGKIITASITNAAVDELKLAVGKKAHAVIKASDVMIAVD